nr:translocation/assembly module TamB domain-containing protein [Polymorphobacter sp.]
METANPETAVPAPTPLPLPERRQRRGGGIGQVLSLVLLLVLLLTGLGYGVVRWLDTESGRAFVVRQLPLFKPESGMTISAGRIDGSIFGAAVIHDLKVGDPKGVFAEIPRLDLDWRPFDLITGTFTARSIMAPEVRVLRLPKLNPSDRILPDFDFDIARFKIDRLVLEPPVSGQRRVMTVSGSADIRAGRAMLDVTALTLSESGAANGGDTVRLKLDAEPDRNKFDMDAVIAAPRGGAIGGMLGLTQPLDVRLSGDGSWQVWQGRLVAQLGGGPLADVNITARSGLFSMKGAAMPARLMSGPAARLLLPQVTIDAAAKIVDGSADFTAQLGSRALAVDARGKLDFSDERIEATTVNARLLNPAAVDPRLRARDARLTARVAGTFKDMLIDYRLTAPMIGWGNAAAIDLRVAGIVRSGAKPLVVPISATAARLTGFGPSVDPLLTNVRVDGPLTIAGGRMTSNGLAFRSDRLNGTATIAVGGGSDFLVTVRGGLPRYPVPGLGVADITADVRIVPAPAGVRVTGRTDVRVTRLDNSAVAAVTGGLPQFSTEFELGGDLSLVFRNARLVSPGLNMTANGSRAANGMLNVSANGVSRDYGRFSLVAKGPTMTPTIDFVLMEPGLGIGLEAVKGRLAPATGGWSFETSGQSNFGPVTAKGLIRTAEKPLRIDITGATIAGMTGSGSVVQTPAGPFAGAINFAGAGLKGVALLGAKDGVQNIDIAATAKEARLALEVPIAIDSGSIHLDVLLPRSGPSVTGSFDFAGIVRRDLRIDKFQGVLSYANGHGSAKASASGRTDIPFSVAMSAMFDPDRIEINGNGKLDDKAITLSGPAVATRGADGWVLAPFSIVTPDGKAEISGKFGKDKALKARFDRVALSLLTVAYPALDLSGRISGTVDIQVPANGVPTGTASLRLNSLSRAGLASASMPIDLGLNAELTPAGGVAKAVIVRGGKVEGRAQAKLGPIPGGGGSVMARLLDSPVFAQFRYNGPAEALWGLAGIEAIDVRGPLSIIADMGGKLGDPKLTGTLRSEGARVESTMLGAVVDQASLDARFTNSRLELIRFSGRAGPGGSISGTGGIDLSAERSFPMDIRLKLKNAQVLGRDDLSGTATGNIRIATDEYGGVVSGKLKVERATFRIGRTAATQVPVLVVTEKNTHVLGRRVATYRPQTRWLLDVQVTADRRLFVSGMGLETEWRADLRIKGGATTPEITGRVELIRGDYDFAGKRFTLTRGDIRFQGVFPPDPLIDIVAESSSNGFTAQLAITGTATRPQIAFSSVPALPEDEVLSRILFGESVTNLSAPEAVQLAGALASLRGGGGGLNPINAVRKGLGIDRLRILPADQTRGRGTSVAAGQYIGRNVYVELVTDAQGYTATNIEVSLTRSLSILSEVATLGGTSVNLRWKRDY